MSSPGRIGPVPVGTRCRPAVPGDLYQGPSACGVPQQSSATWALVQVPAVSTSCIRQLGQWSEDHWVNQLSWVTRFRVQGPAVLTRCPRRLGPRSECPPGRSAVPGNSGPCLKSHRVDLLSWAYWAIVQGPWVFRCPCRFGPVSDVLWGRPSVPVDSRQCLRSCGFHQQFQATRAWVRVPTGSMDVLGD